MNHDIVKKTVIAWVAHFMNTELENISESTELPSDASLYYHLFTSLDKVFGFVANAKDCDAAKTVADVIEIYDGLIPYEDTSFSELDGEFKRNYIIGAIATEAVADKYSIKPETAFRELYLSSKDVADLVYDLEEEFDMHHPSHNYSEIKTVADLLKVFGIAPACDTGSPEERAVVDDFLKVSGIDGSSNDKSRIPSRETISRCVCAAVAHIFRESMDFFGEDSYIGNFNFYDVCDLAEDLKSRLSVEVKPSEILPCNTIKDLVDLYEKKYVIQYDAEVLASDRDPEAEDVNEFDCHPEGLYNSIIGALAVSAECDKEDIDTSTNLRTGLCLVNSEICDLIHCIEDQFDLPHTREAHVTDICFVGDLLKLFGITPACDTGSSEELEAVKQAMDGDPFTERVNHPQHYALPNGMEVIDIARHLSFNLGNVVKYVVRAGRKSEQGLSDIEKRLEDLQKALWYLNDEIALLSGTYNKA